MGAALSCVNVNGGRQLLTAAAAGNSVAVQNVSRRKQSVCYLAGRTRPWLVAVLSGDNTGLSKLVGR